MRTYVCLKTSLWYNLEAEKLEDGGKISLKRGDAYVFLAETRNGEVCQSMKH